MEGGPWQGHGTGAGRGDGAGPSCTPGGTGAPAAGTAMCVQAPRRKDVEGAAGRRTV